MIATIWRGFQFGMFLQIAVGPICIFIFQTATTSGFWNAEIGVLSVTIIDSLYILAAIFGMGAIFNRSSRLKRFIPSIGAAVLIVFGLSNMVGFFGMSALPSLDFQTEQSPSSVFWKTLVLTLSNPLTILFWVGVFSTKVAAENKKQENLYLFGFGSSVATLFFLTVIAILGAFLTLFLEPVNLRFLHLIVGLVLIIFGIRTIIENKKIQ